MECLGRYTFLVMTSVILSCGLNGFEGRHKASRASRAEPPEFRLPRIPPPGGQICAHTGKPCFPYADSAIPCLAGTQATHREATGDFGGALLKSGRAPTCFFLRQQKSPFSSRCLGKNEETNT